MSHRINLENREIDEHNNACYNTFGIFAWNILKPNVLSRTSQKGTDDKKTVLNRTPFGKCILCVRFT